MADFAIKAHDTGPPLEATLYDADGPIDLSTAQRVKLLLGGTKRVNAASVDGECDVLDAEMGEVRYIWRMDGADTAVPDLYKGEFEILWADGTVVTVPNGRYFYVDVVADLG